LSLENFGNLHKTCARSLGPILDAQPELLLNSVSLTLFLAI